MRALLADGPKSRGELAEALDVSPPRVQQLLAELGGAVSSRADPEQGRSRLWSLKGSANGASAAKAARKRTASRGKPTAAAAKVSDGPKGK